MRAFCYSIRDMNYRQMRAYALYRIQTWFFWSSRVSCAL